MTADFLFVCNVIVLFQRVCFFRPSSGSLSQAVVDGVSSLGGKIHGVDSLK